MNPLLLPQIEAPVPCAGEPRLAPIQRGHHGFWGFIIPASQGSGDKTRTLYATATGHPPQNTKSSGKSTFVPWIRLTTDAPADCVASSRILIATYFCSSEAVGSRSNATIRISVASVSVRSSLGLFTMFCHLRLKYILHFSTNVPSQPLRRLQPLLTLDTAEGAACPLSGLH